MECQVPDQALIAYEATGSGVTEEKIGEAKRMGYGIECVHIAY